MEHPLQPSRREPVWCRRAFAFATVLLLAGCANGDFEEIYPSLVRDDIHNWVGRDAVPGKPSLFDLTDDERTLRDLAYPLIEPPYDRHRWYSIAGEYGMLEWSRRASFNRTEYVNRLMGDPPRSPSARYTQLIDDIRNDSTRLPAFFETAGRVIDIDQKRRKSLSYVSTRVVGERKNALRRIEENAAVVGMVHVRLSLRASSYRFALERLVIATPSPQAVEAERLLHQLQAQIAQYRRFLPPTWMREPSLAQVPY